MAAAWAEGQRAAELATAAEQGLEAAKVHHEETEAGLWASLANTEVVLQEALVVLEPKRAALESAQKALGRSRGPSQRWIRRRSRSGAR